MGLSIWFEEDVRRILCAVDQANLETCCQHNCTEVKIYRQGFAAAIRAVATAFGVVVPDIQASFGLPQTALVIPNMGAERSPRLLEIMDEP